MELNLTIFICQNHMINIIFKVYVVFGNIINMIKFQKINKF